MRPLVIESTVDLPAPPDVVWDLITDWERQGDWMLEASDIVVVSPRREGRGVEAEATVRIGGIATRDRIRVDVWDAPRHLGIEHLGWVGGRGDLRLSETRDGTQLDWREELVPPWGLVGGLGIRLFRPLIARTFRRDARQLALLAGDAATGRYPKDS
jgi:carbon monoxide dehydrogenase subunit G